MVPSTKDLDKVNYRKCSVKYVPLIRKYTCLYPIPAFFVHPDSTWDGEYVYSHIQISYGMVSMFTHTSRFCMGWWVRLLTHSDFIWDGECIYSHIQISYGMVSMFTHTSTYHMGWWVSLLTHPDLIMNGEYIYPHIQNCHLMDLRLWLVRHKLQRI